MKLRRLLLAVFAALFLVQMTLPEARAEGLEAEATKTYKYVALGDSNTSGYNLPGADQKPNGGSVVTEELIADPVTNAYPAVFGNSLAKLGSTYGYTTSATNLGANGYMAEDIERVIREEGYIGEYAATLFEDELYAGYHDIFCKYLKDANLVSVLLGGNDMRMSTLHLHMGASQNPLVRAIGTSTSLLFVNRSKDDALEGGKKVLESYNGEITLSDLYEAVNAMSQLSENVDTDARNAADKVDAVLVAVEELNPRASLVLLSLFDPYHDSPEIYAGFHSDLTEIIVELFKVAETKMAGGGTQGATFIESVAAARVATELIECLTDGVKVFNVYAQQVASKHGATYVDITSLDTGHDTDPHPSEQGHADIANLMYNAVQQQIANEMGSQPAPQPTPGAPSVSYAGHQQTYGDLAAVSDGATLGHIGESKRLESVTASVSGIEGASISYRGHVQGIGWTDWVADGALCGTTGQSKRVEALQMRLSGADGWHVWYRVHSQTWGWLGWAKDGEAAGTAGQSRRIEAVEVRVLRDGETPEGYVRGQASFVGYASGEAHVQGVGWTGAVPAGTLGTTGEGRRVEAFRLRIANQPLSGGIEYEAHVQGVGWQGYRADGELAGTEGQSKRVEAVRIRLTGQMADSGAYSVWYRVHSQSYGWLGWAKDGADAGTQGLSKRAEAIEVQIIPAGQVPVGYEAGKDAFVQA